MSKKSNNQGSKKGVISLIACLLAVVIIAGVIFIAHKADDGSTYRDQIALQSENYTVSSAMMNYLFNSNYMQFQSQLDSSKSLKEQKYTEEMTMFDYLMDYTFSQAQQMLILCEGAKAASFDLDSCESDHDHAGSIDEAIETYAGYAEQSGVSLDRYLVFMFGNGVNEDVIRECSEMQEIASHFSEQLYESYEFTEEDWVKYYEDNLDTFRKVNYLTFTMSDEVTAVAENASEEEKAAAKDKDEAKAAVLEEQAAILAASTDPEQFKTNVESYLRNVKYKDKSDEDLEKEKIDIEALVEACLSEGKTNGSESDLNKWLFDEGRKSFETYRETNKEKLSYTVYMILPAEEDSDLGFECMYRDTYKLRDYYYIPFLASEYNNSDSDAKAAAEDVLAEFQADATEEKFEALATAEDGYGGAHIEEADKGQIADEIDEWAFSADRKAGDCEMITVADQGYYLVYYCGEGDIVWQAYADAYLKNDKYSEEYEAMELANKIRKSQKGLDLVDEVSLGN